jgi:hypothetical protein
MKFMQDNRMRIKSHICKAFAAIAIACLSACSNDTASTANEHIDKASFDTSVIRSGDIILKQGFGPISGRIVKYFKEPVPFSHCGILIKTSDSVYVIHSVASMFGRKSGVQTILLGEFLDDCKKDYLYIVRPRLDDSLTSLFAQKAIEFSQMDILFDDEVNNDTKEKMNCSELVHWCYKDNGIESPLRTIKVSDKFLFSFNSMLDSTHFVILKKY